MHWGTHTSGQQIGVKLKPYKGDIWLVALNYQVGRDITDQTWRSLKPLFESQIKGYRFSQETTNNLDIGIEEKPTDFLKLKQPDLVIFFTAIRSGKMDLNSDEKWEIKKLLSKNLQVIVVGLSYSTPLDIATPDFGTYSRFRRSDGEEDQLSFLLYLNSSYKVEMSWDANIDVFKVLNTYINQYIDNPVMPDDSTLLKNSPSANSKLKRENEQLRRRIVDQNTQLDQLYFDSSSKIDMLTKTGEVTKQNLLSRLDRKDRQMEEFKKGLRDQVLQIASLARASSAMDLSQSADSESVNQNLSKITNLADAMFAQLQKK